MLYYNIPTPFIFEDIIQKLDVIQKPYSTYLLTSDHVRKVMQIYDDMCGESHAVMVSIHSLPDNIIPNKLYKRTCTVITLSSIQHLSAIIRTIAISRYGTPEISFIKG